MSIHVALNHVTSYRYDRLVTLGPQSIRLRPAAHTRTRILSYSLRIDPEKHFINWQQDPQANYLARLVFPEKTDRFQVEVDLVAEMSVLNPFDFFLEPDMEHFPFEYPAEQRRELAPYLYVLPVTPRFGSYLNAISREPQRTIDFVVALNQRLCKDVEYLIRMEPGVQAPEETLAKGSGSCRDSGWLLVQLLRRLGIAARFVSGYLIQLKPDVKALDGPSGAEADFTDLHAWCEAYLPGAGWIGFDPTSGLLAGEGHIALACTAEPSAAAPISGSVDECEVEFRHEMKVSRIREAPRVTKPYTEAQWEEIDHVARRIDADLRAQDVRLTQGGEPTFVGIDDRDAAEWKTEALGPAKRRRSGELMRRLKAHYAPHGLLHNGQGKWYPGEQLPRWSLNLFWRKDGERLWSDPGMFADEGTDYGVNEVFAREFLALVARRLDVDAKHVFPTFEDVFYYLWRERRLPANLDPFDSRLDDAQERARLRKVFEQGLGRVVGHVLPIVRTDRRWRSGPWFLRDERCYLVPGDSAMGYRLPLDSLPWVSEGDYPWIHAPDPTQAFVPLAPYRQLRQLAPHEGRQSADRRDARGQESSDVDAPPAAFQSASGIVRTAICAEPRNGRLHLFMPPTAALEDYLELIAAVEHAAERMRMPVSLEGYEPPRDPRLNVLRVTPDPGVVEVNVHPASSWEALVEQTEVLYQAAHESRLSTEKFMLDGRHCGTGGGNHFVLGGAHPDDSPFLRRPELLAAMLAYWHNHPALSYLFSGLFIGPTSQAPRVDEARNDSVYELEVAFAEMERQKGRGQLGMQPWQVDRMLRNLLIDVSGNTHRAEFCIDKLYSPDSPTGRLGLLEMRAFEMPPHARMSLAQQVLMRALVARFWQEPYRPSRLKRWGTELHDRFMLPHFVWDDFGDVLEELAAFGYPLKAEWFAPHLEFRFPRVGDFAARNVNVELRMALEPWNVMGEEGMVGGTVRYVDSSVERLQVKVEGLVGDRHVLTCNGRVLPLQPTGNVGEYVAGVRYRAWQPSSCLHPTIGVHAPLTFDLVDTWMQRSLGGCQYHVAHPGGRSYATFPVNAFEAEARRLARFFRIGHTPGSLTPPREERNPNFPFTLDLRRG